MNGGFLQFSCILVNFYALICVKKLIILSDLLPLFSSPNPYCSILGFTGGLFLPTSPKCCSQHHVIVGFFLYFCSLTLQCTILQLSKFVLQKLRLFISMFLLRKVISLNVHVCGTCSKIITPGF